MKARHILLNPGDEMMTFTGRGTGWQWMPVAGMHHGDPVGDGNPCRRLGGHILSRVNEDGATVRLNSTNYRTKE